MTDATPPPPPPDAPPTEQAAAQPAPGAAQADGPAPGETGGAVSLRRTLRTADAETWAVMAGEAPLGTAAVQFAPGVVEGVLTLPAELKGEPADGMLQWVTELLDLDAAAGPGGYIHWVVATGELTERWRRSPGRRATGAENDLDVARTRVVSVLRKMFPSTVDLPDGGYAVDAGSVRVFVQVPLVGTTVMVRVFSITNLDVPVEDGLATYLLGLNFTLALGRFSLDLAQRSVWCDHVITADDLDDGTLSRTISAVAATADHYDDEIKARFGGRTFREEGSPVEQAATASQGMAGGYL